MIRLVEVKVLPSFKLWLRFEDGVKGEVDLSHLAGQGVFKAWEKPGVFESVRVSEEGALRWSEEIELCTDALYLRITGKKPEEVFSRLKAVRTDA